MLEDFGYEAHTGLLISKNYTPLNAMPVNKTLSFSFWSGVFFMAIIGIRADWWRGKK